MGEGAVIGDEHKALGILVQPARGEEILPAQFRRHQIHHSGLMPVLGGGYHPLGFVEHEIDMFPHPQRDTVHLNHIGQRLHLPVRCLFRLTIHCHPAFPDQFPDLLAGLGALSGQQPVQTHLCHGVLLLRFADSRIPYPGCFLKCAGQASCSSPSHTDEEASNPCMNPSADGELMSPPMTRSL